MRSLDRIPQIDKIRKTFEELTALREQAEKLNLAQKLATFQEDVEQEASLHVISKQSLLLKESGKDFVHVGEVYNRFNQSLALSGAELEALQNRQTLALSDLVINRTRALRQRVQQTEFSLKTLEKKLASEP